MKNRLIIMIVSAITVLTGGVLTAYTAGAATLSCTSKASCGGATLLYSGHGSLDLSVLDPDPNVNGGFGYWNEHVGFELSSSSSISEDFRVAQILGEPVGKGGTYGFGDYVVVYDPAGTDLGSIATPYCLSVQDTYPVVRGHVAQRWADVLRPCFTETSSRQGVPQFYAPATGPNATDEWAVVNPDPYQVWAPVEAGNTASLEFQNVGLNNQSLRHGFAGQNFVLDDRALGGPGTWGLAYPENDQLNQRFRINGCSDPVAQFNAVYWNCTGVVVTS